jgi:MurNAc alpha-1-phosphate uridylyltransferase
MADMLEAHLGARKTPRIVFSDERGGLLDTGGGVKRALPLLGDEPFFVMSSDTLWIDGPERTDNLKAMMQAFDPDEHDCMLLVAERESSVGYVGRGDFDLDVGARLSRRTPEQDAFYMYASVQIMKPSLFEKDLPDVFSNNQIWDALIARGRLVGHVLDGRWLHASSAADVEEIEGVLEAAQ